MSDLALGEGSSVFSFGGILGTLDSSVQNIISAGTNALTKQIDKGSSSNPVAFAPQVNTVPSTLSAQTKTVLLWGAGAVGVLVLLKILKVF